MATTFSLLYDGPIDINADEEQKKEETSTEISEINEELQQTKTSEVDETPFRTDLARFIQNTVKNVGETPLDVAEYFGADVEGAKKVVDNFAYQMGASYGGLMGVDGKQLRTEEDKPTEYETAVGPTLEIGALVTGGTGLPKIIGASSKLPWLIRSTVGGAAVTSILAGRDDNISATLLDLDKTYREAGEEGLVDDNGVAKTVLEFFATEKDDSNAEKRFKAGLEEIFMGTSIAAVMGFPKAMKYSKKLFNKGVSKLSAEESSEVALAYLKDARETINYKNAPTNTVTFTETASNVAQIEAQNKSGLKRFLNQMFTTRGYWTTNADNAFKDAEYAQRQLVAQGENIANRLQIALRDLGDSTQTAEMSKRVQDALEADLGFHPIVAQEAKIQYVVENFDVTDSVAKEILNARQLIDDMSSTLANSSIPNAEFKELILQNSGEYIRRSYRLFEDSGYKPSEDIRQNAVDYLTNTILKSNKNITVEEATEQALGKVDEILAQGSDATEVMQHYEKVRRVNTEILQGKKEIAEPIRKLMGEIREPSENIILTISKLAKLNETNKFFEGLNTAANGRYIFDSAIERNGVAYIQKISGTNSVLDGKYTTPEMITAIKNRESLMITGEGGLINGMVRNFATLKGTSQAVKTIYSHVTHLRNILGGAQFGIANGVNPFTKGGKALATLQNRLTRGGNEAYDALYEEYLRLGVINTNVKVNEFRALLDTGFESTADSLMTNIAKKLPGYGIGKAATEGIQDFYMAVDDFYKISNFERELATLQKAFPDKSLVELKAQAAKIVQDTLPNYDRVPKGIKATRYLPVGNFVAFPTEMWRTSANIVKQAASEISSGNAELMKRGAQRMAGFTTVMGGWSLAADYTAELAGLTQEENEAIQQLSQTPWSKAPKNIVVDADGKIYVNDTQFIDSYSVIKAPLTEIVDRVYKGELKGDDLDVVLGESIINATEALMAPYIEESMLTKALDDVRVAWNSSDGRTSDGKLIFDVNKSKSEQAWEAASILIDSFVPGSINSIEKLAEAYNEKPNPTTGNPKSFGAELTTNLTGVKFTEFNVEEALTYAVKNYNFEVRNIPYNKIKYDKTVSDVVDTYVARQENIYKLQQDLYLKINAASTLMKDDGAVLQILMDSGVDKKAAAIMQQGIFMPETVSGEFLFKMEGLPVSKEKLDDSRVRMMDAYSKLVGTNLTPVDDSKEYMANFEELRTNFATGGVVDVPQAPAEPDERIDKMTGLPYNQQAGMAFMDAEEPERVLQMSCGGHVKKPTTRKRMKKFEGGLAELLGISADDVKWAKDLGKKFGEAEELDGRGDAARHLALGWLASKTNYPSLSKFAADAREVVGLDFKGAGMDWKNNELGYGIKADSREQAEKTINKMIEDKTAEYLTPDESKQMRGY